MRLIKVLTVLVFFSQFLIASEVTISGVAPDYAGEELVFHKYKDRITNETKVLARSKVQEDGTFSMDFEVNGITYVFTDVGIYRGYLYVVPGKVYEIVLPENKPLKIEDELNPFFDPTSIHLGLGNSIDTELNMKIRMFHDAYYPYYNKHIHNLALRQDISQLDDDIERMDAPYTGDSNTFFNFFKEYKYGMLRHLAHQHKARSVSDKFFLDRPVLYNNPAYMELFNQIYERYFNFFSRTVSGAEIYSDINDDQSLEQLKNTLSGDDVLQNDTLLELVILKGLHDEFYDDNFSRSAMLVILDSLIDKSSIEMHKEIGRTIREKVTRLMAGYFPPGFQLYDIDSNLVSLSDYRGKYVYLNFCISYSYTCLNEFEKLRGVHDRHIDYLQIVTISMDKSYGNLKTSIEKNGFPWKFLHYGNHTDVIKDYDIRGVPTYYLIDPEGKLILSPAPGPSENFEGQLFRIMKNRGDI